MAGEAPEHGYVIMSNGEVLCGNMENAPTDPFTVAMVSNLMGLLNKKLEEKQKAKEKESNDLDKDGEGGKPSEETNGASGSQEKKKALKSKKSGKNKSKK